MIVKLRDRQTYGDFAEFFFLFADDAKLFKHVRSAGESAVVQRSCDRLFQWSNHWLLKLNVDKCKVLSIGSRNTTDFTYITWKTSMIESSWRRHRR